jgi:glycosyltransferase involved in cell wall biosynthesis
MTLGEFMAEKLETQFGQQDAGSGRVHIVYPWVDTEKFKPLSKKDNWFSRKHVQLDKLTVMYSGNMGLGHDIETMINSAERLKMVPEVHFMFIGSGPKWHLVQETIEQKSLANVTLLPWQHEDVVPYSLASADVALVSLEPGMAGLAVPSKAIYFMSVGSPLVVLCEGSGELHLWTKELGCGITVGESADLTYVLSSSHQSDYLRKMGENGRAAAEKWFNRKTNTARLIRIIQECGTWGSYSTNTDTIGGTSIEQPHSGALPRQL